MGEEGGPDLLRYEGVAVELELCQGGQQRGGERIGGQAGAGHREAVQEGAAAGYQVQAGLDKYCVSSFQSSMTITVRN